MAVEELVHKLMRERDASRAEAEKLRRSFAEYIAPQYVENRTLVANLCDEVLDRSGALLGYVREAAMRINDPSPTQGG